MLQSAHTCLFWVFWCVFSWGYMYFVAKFRVAKNYHFTTNRTHIYYLPLHLERRNVPVFLIPCVSPKTGNEFQGLREVRKIVLMCTQTLEVHRPNWSVHMLDWKSRAVTYVWEVSTFDAYDTRQGRVQKTGGMVACPQKVQDNDKLQRNVYGKKMKEGNTKIEFPNLIISWWKQSFLL